jgi:hypothetical protein
MATHGVLHEHRHDPDSRAPGDALAVLACDYAARPQGAPSFFDLEDAIRAVRREPDALVLDFDPTRREAVEQLVAAERLCCTEIGWELETAPALRLHIRAADDQLAVFEGFLPRRDAASAEVSR